jgi:DNA-binding NtrC family response regulator
VTARPGSVLVVDDDSVTTSVVAFLLEEAGYHFEIVGTVAEATGKLEGGQFDAVLLDMYLPDGSGMVVLERGLRHSPGLVVLMMTGQAEVRSAVEAMRAGAADYIGKPLHIDDLRMRLERALETSAMQKKLATYEARERSHSLLISHSAAFREALAMADRVAATPASSALLLGESGAGKEVLATRIHEMSARRRGPFVRVNLAAIPDSMIEAELFGSVRGAFTDSKKDRAGFFASAEGGTILLDELCEFKVELQAKLLRALESRRFYRVGSDREQRLDVRVLAATNRDPMDMIARGLLREDLYYRLATITIRVPPLRDRGEDLLPLAEHFLTLTAKELGRGPSTLTPAAARAIGAYHWPGNARELRNAIERAVIMTDGQEVDAPALGIDASPARGAAGEVPEGAARLRDVERQHILAVLEKAGGSKARAAEILGVSRSTLFDKLKKYRIP